MENSKCNQLINNITIHKNISFFELMQKDNQKKCPCHLPIILGTSDTKISKGNEMVSIKYTKCLLCSKNLTYEMDKYEDNVEILDATNYKSEDYQTIEDLERKYWDLLNILQNLYSKYSDEQEVYEKFKKIINNEQEYSLKRTN